MAYRLRIKDEDGKSSDVSMAATSSLTVGRAEGNMIRLPQANVSRKHARLVNRDDGVYLEDLSRYGTRINGARVKDTTRLGTGDVITIGDYELSLHRRAKTGEHQARVARHARAKQEETQKKPTGLRKKPKAVRSGDTTIIRVDELLRDAPEEPQEPQERRRSLLWLVLLGLLVAGGALAAWFQAATGETPLPPVEPRATSVQPETSAPESGTPLPEAEKPAQTEAPKSAPEPKAPVADAAASTPQPEPPVAVAEVKPPEPKPAAKAPAVSPAAVPPAPAAPAPNLKPPVATPPVAKPAPTPVKPTIKRPTKRPAKRPTRVKRPKPPVEPVVKAPTGRDLYREGRKLMASNKAQALEKFQAAAKKNYAKAYKLMGMLYLQKGQTAKAKKAFKRYLKLRPGASDAPQVQDTIDRLGG